jgi:mannose-6-phosphate isomerase-like protein (cupin superfamily)
MSTDNATRTDGGIGVAVDLVDTYVSLAPSGDARTVPVDADFWPDVMAGRRGDLTGGWLVATFDYGDDWSSWERHPAGDEIVSLLTGEVEMVLDDGGTERTVRLTAGRTCVVPRGVWHRAVVHSPAQVLHVTLGDGTEHRPYEPGG